MHEIHCLRHSRSKPVRTHDPSPRAIDRLDCRERFKRRDGKRYIPPKNWHEAAEMQRPKARILRVHPTRLLFSCEFNWIYDRRTKRYYNRYPRKV